MICLGNREREQVSTESDVHGRVEEEEADKATQTKKDFICDFEELGSNLVDKGSPQE